MRVAAIASFVAVVAIITLSGAAAAAPTTVASSVGHPVSSHPMLRAGSSSSTNWAGYAVTGPSGSVTDVQGSWAVPTLSCGSSTTYVAFWVGVDGYSDSTVEQTGVLGECSGGSAVFSAWYEFYPHPMYTIGGISVAAGDVFSAEVSSNGHGAFTATITDTSTSATFSISQMVHSAQSSSAEWIAEAPSSGGSILPLADFGTVDFGVNSLTNSATVSGVTGPIGSFGPSSVQQITLVSSSTNPTGATPTALSSDGSSFTVQTTASSGGSGSGSGLTVSVTTDQSSYVPGSWVYITVTTTSGGTAVAGATVTLTVTAPNGGTSSGSSTTNSAGQVVFKYHLSPHASTGTYGVVATASASGYGSGTGSYTFDVT